MATTSGTLTQKVTSTVSSPAVHYSATYTATRAQAADKGVSVKLTFRAWLVVDGAALGSGIQLTVFARLNGGAWQSVVLKNSADVWRGTDKHTASLTLSANTTDSAATVEFYVSRDGSVYSGTAGVLGSAASPKRYRADLPAYTAAAANSGSTSAAGSASVGTAKDSVVYLRVGGAWKTAVPYVRIGGVWKKAMPYVKAGGVWKAT